MDHELEGSRLEASSPAFALTRVGEVKQLDVGHEGEEMVRSCLGFWLPFRWMVVFFIKRKLTGGVSDLGRQ